MTDQDRGLRRLGELEAAIMEVVWAQNTPEEEMAQRDRAMATE